MDKSLEQLLQQCTVKLSVANIYGWGTGFFVAPGLILTCNHVVSGNANQAAEIGTQVQVRWQEQVTFAEAEVVKSFPNPYDLALLKFNHPKKGKLPCVRLSHNFASSDRLYLFGYPHPEKDHPDGCPVTVNCEGITGEKHIKLKLGQIQPGMSGSALLNQETGMVCGIVKFTLDWSMPLGGGAVQAVEILRLFPELKDLQRQFHQNDKQWKTFARKSATRGMYKLPERSINEEILLLKTSEEVVQRLGRSLYDSVWIDLGMQLQPDKVDCPFDAEIIIGPKPSQPLQSGTSIVDVFDRSEIAGKLLILGDAGSGKTTELSKLAETLLDRAEENINNPIPVFFSLASWQWNESIHNWMVREFVPRGVPKQVSKDLLKAGRVLPLLDGLDELEVTKQEACVNAINRFIGNYEHQYLVVCCRKEAYENLDAKLQLNGAISLQSLSDQQIEVYLTEVGHEELWEKLKESSKLLDLVRTPFLLSIYVIAAQEISFKEWQKIETEKERLRYLLDAYIIRMSKRAERKPIWFHKKKEHEQNFIEKWIASIDRHNYIDEWLIIIEEWLNFLDKKFYRERRKKMLKSYLIYLAKQLMRDSKTEFLVENMQPSWLLNKKARLMYSIIISMILLISINLLFECNQQIHENIKPTFNFGVFTMILMQMVPVKPNYIMTGYVVFNCIYSTPLLLKWFGITPDPFLLWLDISNIWRGEWLNIISSFLSFLEMLPYLAFFAVIYAVSSFFLLPFINLVTFAIGIPVKISEVSNTTNDNEVKDEHEHELIEVIEDIEWITFFPICLAAIILFPIVFLALLLIISLLLGITFGIMGTVIIPLLLLIFGKGFDYSTYPDSFRMVWTEAAPKISASVLSSIFPYVLPSGIFSGLIYSSIIGFFSKKTIRKITFPNQGVRQSFFGCIVAFLVSFIFCAAIIAIYFHTSSNNLLQDVGKSFINSVFPPHWFATLLGLCLGLRFGGKTCIQHFSLRLVLWGSKLIPWNYAQFLGYSTERRFLQQAGGRYWFIHRFLQEHFAEMPLNKNVTR
ncbi:serine protease [Microcoleus sp. PH2017_08_TRC_O_A]|jgi:GTPase SAR1 family protein|uniref:serine protease n=1 Tax=Microcoleus sp. PH2017_08_TRC_O_A TaxID=2798819 RepID=UPI001D6FFC8A|nr:serine protease [Microcoleus sp. PH2017_08_TRC_O_A]MCC3457474.1 trypsin-like peptidase domain-containing protein [Microcoleus sp. PH2017_08_TRC_O_A]